MFFFFYDTGTTEIYTYRTLFPYTTLFRSGQRLGTSRRLAERGGPIDRVPDYRLVAQRQPEHEIEHDLRTLRATVADPGLGLEEPVDLADRDLPQRVVPKGRQERKSVVAGKGGTGSLGCGGRRRLKKKRRYDYKNKTKK